MLVRRSGVQSVFQFIPKVFSGVEVRTLCRTLEFFHSNLHTPCLHGARFVHRGIVMLEQSVFQFIPKVFSGVEVRTLCRTLEFFHSNLHTPCLHGARFVHRGIVMLEQPHVAALFPMRSKNAKWLRTGGIISQWH
ncbi:hypothetical protein PGIGA_G00143630 [Pangasianodon gigas]|uniref:Uncharacterized protein n=1 Tax=Pangasianodon gigas TaxID=30993 RepID=A0ACC5XLR1_PANGG|nr:hypothetical protein [Pangasianodon gigas]